VLSRDGTRMAVTYDGGNYDATMVDVATATVAPATEQWNFGTFTPDSAQFLSVEKGILVVRNSMTQGVLATMTSATYVSHPDLSPDGKRLVYDTNPNRDYDWQFDNGAIYTRTYDQATRTFGPEQPLVNDGNNNFYPTWSPDGNWIAVKRGARLVKARAGGDPEGTVIGPPAGGPQGGGFRPTWSPTGDWISWCNTKGDLLLVRPDDSETVTLANLPRVNTVGWSKDGSTAYGLDFSIDRRLTLRVFDVRTRKQLTSIEYGVFPDVSAVHNLSLAPDGRSFATSILRDTGDIWVLDGFRAQR
jgi:hypothetical protein